MMDHWQEVLPGRVLQVNYEEVVADLDGQVRRLLDYCELPWEDACLDFHKNTRPVNTASAEQVRLPIYTDAIDFWKHYELQLEPAREDTGAGVMKMLPLSTRSYHPLSDAAV